MVSFPFDQQDINHSRFVSETKQQTCKLSVPPNLLSLEDDLMISLGKCLRQLLYDEDTAEAISLPKSAITVSVKGIPIKAKPIQKTRPQYVFGAMFP
jgi:hypothetical protein